ncbi:ParA family protein [Nitrosospira sp. NRS527]|uniref:ParA family protein n=1 Tax=Nitrosospira sp. NRS527 TaxID=155925 RepID=UPI001AFBD056|nr:ParA family protein [Nitrosospira sp. NRS527]BCT69584.1 Chromosome-partitioning ATPase Soj [Nitrosospira sp. NRS527]
MKILTVANQKGGVGKTTIALHLTHMAKEQGLRVLLAELDPQSNASNCFIETTGTHLMASNLFDETISGAQPEATGGIGLIRPDRGLYAIESLGHSTQFYPANHLRHLGNDYDLCIIDTPPTLGVIQLAAIIAADYVVAPSHLEKFSLEGFSSLTTTIRQVRDKGLNRKLKFLGFLANRVKSTSKQQSEALTELRETMGKALMPFVVHDRVAVSDAAALGNPVWYKPQSESHRRAAREMSAACEYILKEVQS